MKYIDFSAQTILFVATIVILIATFGQSDWPMTILVMQLLIGPWQILSALVLIVAKTRFKKPRVLYLLTSAVYLAALPVIATLKMDRVFMSLLFMGPAWSLAIFYYALTYVTLFKKPSRNGSFLPHLSF
jgi:predicted membrane channel-forming protein YqfA (hemolysin III family)